MKFTLMLCLALPLAANAFRFTDKKLGDTTKKENPVTLFAPGLISSDAPIFAAPAFSPDGCEVYFGEKNKDPDMYIMVSHKMGSQWSVPAPAAFSGIPALEPAYSPDGRYLIFASSRPSLTGGKRLDGNYNGKIYPGKGGNLWKVKWIKGHWSDPEILPTVINAGSAVFSPAIAGSGSLYFMRSDTGGKFHIYRSQFKKGVYETPVKASFCLDQYGDFDPVVAPDESFLIYSTGRPPAQPGRSGLFIVFKTPAGWSEPLDLRTAVSDKVFGVEARLSTDLKTLYFSNNVNEQGVAVPDTQYIWQVDISGLLKSHGVSLK